MGWPALTVNVNTPTSAPDSGCRYCGHIVTEPNARPHPRSLPRDSSTGRQPAASLQSLHSIAFLAAAAAAAEEEIAKEEEESVEK